MNAMAPTITRQDKPKDNNAQNSGRRIRCPSRGSKKSQKAPTAASTMETTPGPKPPYHAETAMQGKKKMNGSAVGPTLRERARLASKPKMTQPTATPYRSHQGRIRGCRYDQASGTLSTFVLPVAN